MSRAAEFGKHGRVVSHARAALARVTLSRALAGAALTGCTQGPAPEQISESGFGAFEVSLATTPDSIAVGWYDTRHGNPEIYVRVIDGSGAGSSDAFRLTETTTSSFEVDLDSVDGGFVAAWYERESRDLATARVSLWSPGSGVAWNKPLSETGRSTRNPVLLARDAEIFAAWIEEDESGRVDVWGGWWDLDGMPSVAAFPIGPASAGTWNLNAAFDGAGRPVVVFDATVETDAEEIFIARLDRQNVDLRRVTADDGARSKYPDIGFSGAEAALTWFDERDGNREIYLFVGPVARLAEGFESEALRVTRTPGHSIGAYLHWSEDQLGLAWSDDSDGAYDIYFQTFDRTGRPIVQARRLTSTAADSLIPAIRSWNGSFALAWNEVSYMPPEPEGHSPDARSEIMFSLVR